MSQIISKIEINNLFLKNFPNIELFYNHVYKKVYSYEYLLAIPKGNKSFVWFTHYNNFPVAILMNISYNSCNNYDIINAYVIDIEFKNDLINAIFYGTNLIINEKLYFFIEELFNYKNICMDIISDKNSFLTKINSINYILKNEIFFSDNKNSIIFGTPLIHNNYSKLLNLIKNAPYEIKEITYILNDAIIHSYHRYKNYSENNIFKVCKTNQTDIYKLYSIDENKEYKFHSIAYIPNYKTSTMMNKIFHNLKDKSNLDYLEDSDDEECSNNEKENEQKKQDNILMICKFNYKFEKWIPITLFNK